MYTYIVNKPNLLPSSTYYTHCIILACVSHCLGIIEMYSYYLCVHLIMACVTKSTKVQTLGVYYFAHA